MRWAPVPLALTLALALSGCLHSHPARPTPASDETVPSAVAEPGLFRASPAGLERIEGLPGLTIIRDGATTHYSLNVLERLEANGDPLFLVQALEDGQMDAAIDIGVTYVPPAGASDLERPDAVCLGTAILHDASDHGFYLARALGQDAAPPTVRPDGGIEDGIGRGRSGPTQMLVQLYGDRLEDRDQRSFALPAGDFVRFSNPLSQLTPLMAGQPGNHWWQNWTVSGAHRLVAIPPAPVFCASGFREFTDAQVAGDPAIGEVTLAGHLQLDTLYGATVRLDVDAAGLEPQDPDPANSVTVDALGRHCRAGGGQGVYIAGFEAGTVRLDVQRWVGNVVVVVAGTGLNQQMWNWSLAPPQCGP